MPKRQAIVAQAGHESGQNGVIDARILPARLARDMHIGLVQGRWSEAIR